MLLNWKGVNFPFNTEEPGEYLGTGKTNCINVIQSVKNVRTLKEKKPSLSSITDQSGKWHLERITQNGTQEKLTRKRSPRWRGSEKMHHFYQKA